MSPLTPLLVAWLAGIALLMADGSRRTVACAGLMALVAVAGTDLWLLASMARHDTPAFAVITGNWPAGVGIRLHVDEMSLLFGLVSTGPLAAVMYHEMRARTASRWLPATLLLMCAGLHGAYFTGDLFNFYVFFELAIVTSFALAGHGRGPAESRSAFVYMIVNLLGSVLFLLGVTGIYHHTGSLDFRDIAVAAAAQEPELLLIGAALLFTALALKLGLFPFHGWLVPVYTYVRPPVAAALAGALVNIGAYGLIRIGLDVLPDATAGSRWLLLTLGAAATLYGSLLAFRRRPAAELAAYLAIVHAGYVMLGFGLGTALGIAAVLLVVIAGSIDKTAMFLALDLCGRARRQTAFLAMLGVAGLPLSTGFIAKLALFHAGATGTAGMVVIVALLLAAPFTIAAGVRFWRLVLAGADPAEPRPHRMPYVLPAISLLLGAVPQTVGTLTTRIGSGLLGPG